MSMPARIAVALAATLASVGSVLAVPCYVVYDRNDVVIYRDVDAPFDMSVQNPPERVAMRKAGAHLLFADFESCLEVRYVSPTSGVTAVSVDEIVMQLKPAINTSVGAPGAYVSPGTRMQ